MNLKLNSVGRVLKKSYFYGFLLLLLLSRTAFPASPPNIIYILADDLGYGDVGCMNPESRIPTPQLDALASRGMVFTDAHSSSAVCTPTRYGVLTGRYNWRSRLKKGVLGGYSRRLIEPDRTTVPSLLKDQGYRTACLGKWHLGMDWPLKNGGIASGYKDGWDVDYSKPITNGPNAIGFDYFFGISASLDMPPYVYIENDHSVGLPTVEKRWIRKGPAHTDFEAIDVLPRITAGTSNFIRRHAASGNASKPFFIYVPLNAPHTPILPTKEWQGKSGLNAYADFVMQVDDSVGQIVKSLFDTGVADNTLVIFTSDNGCSPQAKFKELAEKGHDPSHPLRGHKADIYEGGHRVPFIACWPQKIRAGTRSSQLICLTDLMATCADIIGISLPDQAGEDSFSLLPIFTGKARGAIREAVVHHSINGSFSIRKGKWKLELCSGSGGWSAPRPGSKGEADLPPVQLYDLEADIAETKNLHDVYPDKVDELTRLLEEYVRNGRSNPGAVQENNGSVDIRLGLSKKKK